MGAMNDRELAEHLLDVAARAEGPRLWLTEQLERGNFETVVLWSMKVLLVRHATAPAEVVDAYNAYRRRRGFSYTRGGGRWPPVTLAPRGPSVVSGDPGEPVYYLRLDVREALHDVRQPRRRIDPGEDEP